ICDPNALPPTAVEQIARGYVRGLRDMIGPDTDIPAPDVNTNSRIMGWMLDEYLKSTTAIDFSVFTGKSLNLGGIEGRTGATGLGIAYVTREACKVRGVDLKGARVAVQGFGNVGRGAAQALTALGARIVGVTDITGGVYKEDGLDVAALTEYARDRGGVAGFPGAEPLTNEQLFALPVDVLIPAALEGQITGKVAETIQAPIVVEGANGPTTPEGAQVLADRGIMQVPDILANGGGVTVSYFEWVQGQQGGLRWSERTVHRRLDRYMTSAFAAVLAYSERYNVSMREAAYLYAVDRLATGMIERGWVPR
ncbi:MAG: glutamate dehydrogenase, partial [Symbiobacterium thermophilum]